MLEKFLMSRFIRGRNITFPDEIKEIFAEENFNGFQNNINVSSLLWLLCTNRIKEEHVVVNLGKHNNAG